MTSIPRIVPWALFLVVAGLFGTPAQAQDEEETLIGGDVEFGGFGGPVLKVGHVAGDAEVLTGGRGGWIINVAPQHTVVLGGGGYGLTTGLQVSVLESGPDFLTRTVDMGYGGFELEYVNRTKRLVHVSVLTLIGAGGLTVRDTEEFDPDGDAFFIAEPQANLMLNVTHFFRLGVGVSYRWVNGADYAGLDDADLRGMAGVLMFKFGKF